MERPLDRLKRKVEVENLWLFILKLLSEKKRCGKEIREEVTQRFGFWIGNVTAYKVLYLLERSKYITSKKLGKRRMYELTAKGKRELEEALSYLRSILSRLGQELHSLRKSK